MLRLKERKAKGNATGRPEVKSELRELADRYLAWQVATRYTESTVKGSSYDLAWLLRYLEGQGIDRIADGTAETLADYSRCIRKQRNTRHENRKISLAHVLHRLSGIKQFFGWLTGQNDYFDKTRRGFGASAPSGVPAADDPDAEGGAKAYGRAGIEKPHRLPGQSIA